MSFRFPGNRENAIKLPERQLITPEQHNINLEAYDKIDNKYQERKVE